ncbi:MAG: DHA2 family efflux MFS transporter permease subunit [Steroidobacteraceae bacterium]
MNATAAAAMPPALAARALVATGLALATFMQVLDTTIANVSIPTIAGDLGVSIDQGTWIITSFGVSNAIALPLTGRLTQRYGVVKVFVTSVILFTLASFLCGVAWSLSSLVVFRILQGVVSGPMIPGSQALLLSIFPPEKKGIALVIWSTTTLVAPVCGPILGGYVADNYSWPWIFLLNVPFGVFCAYVCARGLRHHETPTQRVPIDMIGSFLLVAWVGAMQIMLDTGKDKDWFSSPLIRIEALVAVLGFITFIIWELGEKNPIIDLSLFRNRNFALGMIPYALGYATFFGAVLLPPLWMQTRLGYTATWAGLAAAPAGIAAVVLSPFVGKYFARIDARVFATAGFIAFASSYLMRAELTADASFAWFVLPSIVQGIGMSVFFVAMLNIILGDIEPHRIPFASGVSNFVRITSGSFAASLTTTFWDRHASVHQSRLAEATSVFDPRAQQALDTLHGMGLNDAQSLSALVRSLESQAYFLSALDFFWISGWITFAIIIFVWFTRRSRGAVQAAAE